MRLGAAKTPQALLAVFLLLRRFLDAAFLAAGMHLLHAIAR